MQQCYFREVLHLSPRLADTVHQLVVCLPPEDDSISLKFSTCIRTPTFTFTQHPRRNPIITVVFVSIFYIWIHVGFQENTTKKCYAKCNG